ncbi:MAG: DUF1926 domain-containing protein [Spirochaetales bacterium]|jgi:alpha-amylase|nr:DUF1926 domain-containing protein [Spirochaetales bacterium]
MEKPGVIIGLAVSLPFGVNGKAYETFYQEQCRPLLTVLSRRPVPLALYLSAYYLEWLENRHPEAVTVLRDLSKLKQAEMLGGAFYEPLFPLIPLAYRHGHIEEMTTLLRRTFSRRPRGSWLGDGVWEPTGPSSFKNSGIDYVFINDTHFKAAGLKSDDLTGPFLTEDQGKTLLAFPVDSEAGRYFLDHSPQDSYAFFCGRLKAPVKKEEAGRRRLCSVFFSTEEWEHRNLAEWLDGFFGLVEGGEEFLPELPEKNARPEQRYRKVYLPCLIPGRMLPDRKRLPSSFNPRSLLDIYPEFNFLYAKQVYVSLLVSQYRGDRIRKKNALLEIRKAQHNRFYWYPSGEEEHYRAYRQAAYKYLIAAEDLVRESGVFHPSLFSYDFTMDGIKSYLYRGEGVNAYVHREGGRLFEFDSLERPWNYQAGHCHFQPFFQSLDSFVDGFLTRPAAPREGPSPSPGSAAGEGETLAGVLYKERVLDGDLCRLGFELEIKVPDLSGKKRPLLITKDFAFKEEGLTVSYGLKNLSAQDLEFNFTTELNFSFASPADKLLLDLVSRGRARGPEPFSESTLRDIKSCRIQDEKNKMALLFSVSKNCTLAASLKRVPPGGGSLLLAHSFLLGWRKTVEAQKTWTVEVSLRLEKLTGSEPPPRLPSPEPPIKITTDSATPAPFSS